MCIAAVGTLMLSVWCLPRAAIRTSVFARLHCLHASFDVFHVPPEDQTAQRGGVMDQLPCVSGTGLGCPTCPTSFAICKDSEWSDARRAAGRSNHLSVHCHRHSAHVSTSSIKTSYLLLPARSTSPEQNGCSMPPLRFRTLDSQGGSKLGLFGTSPPGVLR